MSVLPGTVLHCHRAVDSDQKKKQQKNRNSSLKKNLVDGLGCGERFPLNSRIFSSHPRDQSLEMLALE